MENTVKNAVWNHFLASMEMLENAILACTVKLWDTETKFWYNAFHCLFFLDYYLTTDKKFRSPGAVHGI